jgi:two-component system phosphate regulon sensor histidine kinase PhoR
MSDGVALLDGSNRILRANHSLAAMLGTPLPPVPGTPLRDVLRAPEVEALVGRSRAVHHAVEIEFRHGGADPRVMNATATPLGPSASDSLLLVLHDRTEEERTVRMRQDFVANVSHELRTPLTSLRGYAETLLEGGLEDVQNRERFVRVIRDQAVRLAALIDDLLSLATLEAPGTRLRIERFDLRDLAEQSVRNMAPRAVQTGLSLTVVPGDPVPVAADRARLEQVVANLVDNALKYTERGGVTLRVGTGDRGAWCEVADTGPGIPLEDQPRIFERFYRVDKARSREKGGTGLGLSIVRHILALHGGQVSVRSRPNQGTVFRIELPPTAERRSVVTHP